MSPHPVYVVQEFTRQATYQWSHIHKLIFLNLSIYSTNSHSILDTQILRALLNVSWNVSQKANALAVILSIVGGSLATMIHACLSACCLPFPSPPSLLFFILVFLLYLAPSLRSDLIQEYEKLYDIVENMYGVQVWWFTYNHSVQDLGTGELCLRLTFAGPFLKTSLV